MEAADAFIVRLHHSLADGIALVQVLLSLTEPAPGILPAGQSQAPTASGFKTPSGRNQAAGETTRTLKSSSLVSNISTKGIVKEGIRTVMHPSLAVHRFRQSIDFTKAVGKIALRWPDPATLFKGPLGTEKRAAWSDPLDLARSQIRWRSI